MTQLLRYIRRSRGSGPLVAKADSAAADRMDLLTVVMHEMGHLLGVEHEVNAAADDTMDETLLASQRHLPSSVSAFDEVFRGEW